MYLCRPIKSIFTKLINKFKFSTNTKSLSYNHETADQKKINSPSKLTIPTYEGSKDQPVHPKVLYFENRWNGYKYWMAYTPYPKNDSFHENPCIAFSNDGRNWSSNGINNPIDSVSKSEQDKNYFSDTHLVYRPDENILECWYRKAISKAEDGFLPGTEVIYRKTSRDGINWGDKQVLHAYTSGDLAQRVCPVAIYDEGKYKIWVATRYLADFIYFESIDGDNWQHIRDITLQTTGAQERLWHFDIIKTNIGYEVIGTNITTAGVVPAAFYTKTTDNINFNKPVMILTAGYKGSWDDNTLHRPSLVQISNKKLIYYSGRNSKQKWGIGLIEIQGDIEELNKLIK